MTRLDLGTLSGTLLFFGGPYSNLQATQAMHNRAQQLGISPSNIICTGDSVAYCAQPNETLELIQDWGIHLLMGNCEESLAEGADDCGCGFEAGTACDLLSDSWYRYASKNLKPIHKQWLGNLPRCIEFKYVDKRYAVIHGGVEQINQFIFQSSESILKLAQIEKAQLDGVVAGHCGLPFTQVVEGKLWHNPGVIGMPANDGTSRVWYALWNNENGRIKITHCYLHYDFAEAQRQMRQVGLANGYADALQTGLWPSMDVLPSVERTMRAQPVREATYIV